MGSIIIYNSLLRYYKISLKKLKPIAFFSGGQGTHIKQFVNGFPVSGSGGNL